MQIEERINRRNQRVLDRGLDGGRHSRSYHKFFEGYTEYTVPQKRGDGKKIIRVYTADYYKQDLSIKKSVLLRILYVMLLALSLLLFWHYAKEALAVNGCWYVVLAQAGTVVGMFWLCAAFLSYLPVRKMTVYEFHSASIALKRASLFTGIFNELIVLFGICFLIFEKNEDGIRTWIAIAAYAAGGIILFGIHLLESAVKYTRVPNETQNIWNGVEID